MAIYADDKYIQDIRMLNHAVKLAKISRILINKKPTIFGRFAFWWVRVCIDLTSGMDDFAKWFKTNGKDLILYVEY